VRFAVKKLCIGPEMFLDMHKAIALEGNNSLRSWKRGAAQTSVFEAVRRIGRETQRQ
jgi:hypothetical protein